MLEAVKTLEQEKVDKTYLHLGKQDVLRWGFIVVFLSSLFFLNIFKNLYQNLRLVKVCLRETSFSLTVWNFGLWNWREIKLCILGFQTVDFIILS